MRSDTPAERAAVATPAFNRDTPDQKGSAMNRYLGILMNNLHSFGSQGKWISGEKSA